MPDLFLYLSLVANVMFISIIIAMKMRLVRFMEKESNLIVQLGQAASEIATLRMQVEEITKEKGTWRDRTVEASVRIKNLDDQLVKSDKNTDKLLNEKEDSFNSRQQAEIQLEASRQKLKHMQRVMEDWET
ncbi:MAG: hypothetical protein JKX98_08080, partial [Alcanivoracaceae bacterium]|nr:hypothetical protein [Alcanivoracaceae bacterium]